MNNKPVAWMVNNKAYVDIFEAEHYSKFANKPMIPLYTHLVKELTDEEMLECAKSAGCVFDYSYKGEVTFISKDAFKRFVKAILRKVQEK